MRIACCMTVAWFALVAHSTLAFAQDTGSSGTRPLPTADASRLDEVIMLDGRLDEGAWERATPATGFRQYQPDEGAPASFPTEVRILFDDRALYVGARMSQPGGVIAPLARRDQLLDASGDNGSFNSLTTDKLILRLDPYHNHLDDAWFEVNPSGAKGEKFNGDPDGLRSCESLSANSVSPPTPCRPGGSRFGAMWIT